MNILLLLVVATLVIAGVYVGYHASQQGDDGGIEGHGSAPATLYTVEPTLDWSFTPLIAVRI